MRIGKQELNQIVESLNVAFGYPTKPYTREDGKLKPNANNFHLSWAYGGVSLHQMSDKPGCTGIKDVFSCGHISKRDLYERIRSYALGYNAHCEHVLERI